MDTKKGTSAAPAQTNGSGRVHDPKQGVVNRGPLFDVSSVSRECNYSKVKWPAKVVKQTEEAIDHQWLDFPPGAKKFIVENPNNGSLDIPALIDFWSSPRNIPCTRGHGASCLSRAAWYLAFWYLKLGMCKESQSLIMNGAFLHQCRESSIEYFSSASECGINIPWHEFPLFGRGVDSLRCPKQMELFIVSQMPPEDTQRMTTYANPADKNPSMRYIDQVAEDWSGTSSASKKVHRRSSPNDNETQIELILVDDSEGDSRHSFEVGSSTTLKALFNNYADKRGISLRSLRFSYASKTLFLSSAGRKTPDELEMRDKDIIVVHDTTRSNSKDDNGSSQRPATSKKTPPLPARRSAPGDAKKKSKKKKTKKKQKRKEQQQRGQPSKTLEDYKVEHSKQLTKIHGEAHDQFRRIRQRLNNLAIERSQPKIKTKCQRLPKDALPFPSAVSNAFDGGLGGKAGKSRYAIQVGEVNNLYKTTKPSVIASSHNRSSNDASSILDLHGCTREEALTKLDGALETWVDIAMQGSYPFILPATIICGCGNQILSEVVQEWIRSNDRVSNAPKFRSPKQ